MKGITMTLLALRASLPTPRPCSYDHAFKWRPSWTYHALQWLLTRLITDAGPSTCSTRRDLEAHPNLRCMFARSKCRWLCLRLARSVRSICVCALWIQEWPNHQVLRVIGWETFQRSRATDLMTNSTHHSLCPIRKSSSWCGA